MKKLITILCLSLIVGGCSSYPMSGDDNVIAVPKYLKIKAPKDKILNVKFKKVKDKDIAVYTYKSEKIAEQNVIPHFDKDALFSSVIYANTVGATTTIRMYGANNFWRNHKDSNIWKEIEHGATTTKKIWDDSMEVSWWKQLLGQPVYAISSSTFATVGDGWVGYDDRDDGCSTWQCTHDAVSGETLSYTSIASYAYAQHHSVIPWGIFRGFFPFPTGAIGEEITVSAATIKLKIYSTSYQDNDAQAYMVLAEASQASDIELVLSDYSEVGTVALSDTHTISGINKTAYTTFTMTGAGLANISGTDNSRFSFREGHDFEDISINPSANVTNSGYARTIEQPGTSEDPLLEFTYTTSGGGGAVKEVFISDETMLNL